MENTKNMLQNKIFIRPDRVFNISMIISLFVAIFSFIIGTQMTGLFQPDLSSAQLTIFEVFIHNTTISLLLLVGVFSYGFISFVLIISNFAIFGMQINTMISRVGFLSMANKIIWHIFLELPAIILAATFGFYLFVSQIILEKDFNWKNLGQQLRTVIILVMPLNFLAAVIETLVSNRIGDL
ncbi:stage II sporulation protein M [Oenococcus oeni ATCC BAA-1163]|uniref:Stage II sporulation protein M n=3 Tax=Oenococcus oeni TaxID=1247 RepID=A0NK33_OENOE|nr:stage II sporulation protein M [Oenococcus oeni ATCC BAA-1163]